MKSSTWITSSNDRITVAGAKTDAEASALHGKSFAIPRDLPPDRMVDRSEDPPPNTDVEYPEMEQPRYIYVNKACSLPIFNPVEVIATADCLLEIR